MRSIQLDDATYAALWAQWREGDQGEVGVIRRLLKMPSSPLSKKNGVVGFIDKRSGTVFAQGFEIFRTFKGQNYLAVADSGVWRLQDGRTAASLNILSALIGAPTENAWIGWNYRDGKKVVLITKLRDPKNVVRRTSSISSKSSEELGL